MKLLALVMLAILAGCVAPLGGPESPAASVDPLAEAWAAPVTAIEDEAGDAMDVPRGAYTCAGQTPGPWVAGVPRVRPPDPVAGACEEALRTAAPGPASLDATAVRIVEGSRTLIVELEIASLDESFSGAVRADSAALYWVGWKHEGYDPAQPGWDYVRLEAVRSHADGKPSLVGWYQTGRDAEGRPCNDYAYCMWLVPFEVEYGSPAVLRWHVPRGLVQASEREDVLTEVHFNTFRILDANAGEADGVHTEPTGNMGMSRWRALVGSAPADGGVETEFTFALKRSAHVPTTSGRVADGVGDLYGDRGSPDVDLLSFELVETKEDLTLAVEIARVSLEGDEIHLDFEIGLPGGRVLAADVHPHNGMRIDWSSMCKDAQCEEEINIEPRIVAVEGEPGWLNFTYPRAPLGAPGPGLLNLIEIEIYDVVDGPGTVGPARSFDTTYDWMGGPPIQLQLTSAEGSPTTDHILLRDAKGDLALPPDVVAAASDPDSLDVVHLQANAITTEEIQVTVGIQNLSSARAPSPYDAVLYAAAFETSSGPFMMGYLKENDQEDGEFFCAEDTAFFSSPRTLPPSDFRQPIEGSVSGVHAREGRERASLLTFEVPVACLGLPPGDVDVTRSAAGTFLARSLPTETLVLVDDVASEEPALLHAVVATPQRAWYESPFGLANFWDIFGVAAALAVSAAGVGIVRHRRRLLRRLLAEIDAALKAHAEDPAKRERALAAIRESARAALLRGRLHEEHFGIVDRRIEHLIAAARIEVFSETFRDLPHWLVVKLQKLMGDGALTADDYRVLAALVDSADVPAATKAKVRGKLAGWVAAEQAVVETDP